jgi:ketosteroid isomerase-like protein
MAYDSSAGVDEQQIVERERAWNAVIQRRDGQAVLDFLGADYRLLIGVQGMPLQVVPRAAWLAALDGYVTESFSIDDIRVRVYGDTAIAVLLYTQQVMVRGQDRSGQFMLTDIWVRRDGRWQVAERHSSRPEPAAGMRP